MILKDSDFIKKDQRELFNISNEVVPYISYKCFDELSFIKNAFTLRKGADGSPIYMFPAHAPSVDCARSFSAQLAKELGTDLFHRVFAQQKHTANVHLVNKSDIGHSFEESPIRNTDALITNIPGTHLCISVADCIPLCFVDPVKKAIGVAHSGRRGTQLKIGRNVVDKMHSSFGSDPKDILATIGPGICQDCYEVGPEILEEFKVDFGADACKLLFLKKNEHYYLDLLLANKMLLLDAGLQEKNIVVSNICNRCNSDKFYSFRADGRIINQIHASLLLT